MSRTISGNYQNGLTLTDTADNPVYIAQGVSVTNGGGAALVNGVPLYWSITNRDSALIAGTSFGISLSGAGSVANAGTVTASYLNPTTYGYSYNRTTKVLVVKSAALYLGGGDVSNGAFGVVSGGIAGVAMAGGGSVVNAGAISNTAANYGFGIALASGGGVTNATGGSIAGGQAGVLIDGTASITNQTGATITGGARGIFVVNGAGSVSNQGAVSGGKVAGLYLAGGGTVTNQSGGLISGGYGGIIVLKANGSITNQGVIQQLVPFNSSQKFVIGGVLVLAGGRVDNSGGTITGRSYGVYVTGAAGTVTNTGSISTDRSGGGAGVFLAAGGSVTNAAGGSISSAGYTVLVANAAGTVINAGSISSDRNSGRAGVVLAAGGSVTNAAGGSIDSGGYSVIVTNALGTVTNAGLIVSYAMGGGAAVALTEGGSVTNSSGGLIAGEFIGVQFGPFGKSTVAAAGTFVNEGTVSASDIHGNGAAVWMHGPGLVINRAGAMIEGGSGGKIVGGPLNGFGSGPFGIVAYYQSTVINYGSIGGAKYAFDAANSITSVGNRIEIAPGSTFGGVVLGAHNAASASLSTLELMSGASMGTVAGFGTHYKYFGNVTIDDGARWRLGGSVSMGTTIAFNADGIGSLTFAAPAQMQGTITGFAAGDAIGLDGVTVTGSTFADGVLTLIQASGTISLAIPGSYTSNQFAVKNLAGGGVEVSVVVPPRILAWTGAGGSAFGAAANWNDITNGKNPARLAPNATDTIEFGGFGAGVTGTGTVAAIDVGMAGTGALNLGNGATLVAGSFQAGVAASAVGRVGLAGSGTNLTVAGDAVVADGGTGILSVLNGATFAAADLAIGALSGSSGALVVSGAGSELNLTGALNIGSALGIGDLTVGPGAAVHASVVNLRGQVVLEGGLLDPTVQYIAQDKSSHGFGTIAAGEIIVEGSIEASQKLLVVQGTVVGGGTLTVNGTVQASDGAGMLRIDAGATLELTGPVLNAASTIFTDDLASPGTYTVNNSAIDVMFADATGVLRLDDIAGFGGTITSFQAGDAIVISGGTLSGLGVSNGNTLTVLDSGAGGTDRLIFWEAIDPASFGIVNGNTIVSCFAVGTRIGTVDGPVAVEDLRVGNRVRTQRGGAAGIIWIGQRKIDCRQHPNPVSVHPVLVCAGAFGPGTPARDLWLSPDHAVFVENVLIPVHCLINNGTIRRMEVSEVTYYHVELPEHDVILAEGLPVESYLDTGDRTNFSNAGGEVRLFPDFSARTWEMAGCAPLVMTGPVLERVRRGLADRRWFVAQPRPPWTRLNNRYTYY